MAPKAIPAFAAETFSVPASRIVAAMPIASSTQKAAVVASGLVDAALRDGSLVQILPDRATDGLPLHLVWRRNRQLLPKVDALPTFLGDALTIR